MTDRGTHHQRRPPDVEEALSSMLWTPYEHTPNNSSSEEDEDERLNRHVRKSQSTNDYHYEPLTSSYFGTDDMLPTTASSNSSEAACLQPTPFVPFSNLISTIHAEGSSYSDLHTQAFADFPKNYEAGANSFRYSYPYYGPIPSLAKWWSSTGTAKEPPSYDSLYAKSANPPQVILKPVRHTLQASMEFSSQCSGEERLDCDISNGSQQSLASHEQLKHSFTDDFISRPFSSIEVATNFQHEHQQHQQEPITMATGNELRGTAADTPTNEPTSPMPHAMNAYSELMRLDKTTSTAEPVQADGSRAGKISVPTAREVRGSFASCVLFPGSNSSSLSLRTRCESLHPAAKANPKSGATTNSGACALTLTPNKCLAELERLYEEFRASESIFERSADFRDISVMMRLNIPATDTSAVAVEEAGGALKVAPATTSSVFLTTTNSVTTNSGGSDTANYANNNNNNNGVAILTTSACQRQPSLTIQVNNNNNADIGSASNGNNMTNTTHNNNNNNNNNVNLDFILNQSIVNNNGVSVVNCSYFPTTPNTSNNNHSTAIAAGAGGSCVNVNSSSAVPNSVSSRNVKNSYRKANNLLNNNHLQVADPGEESVNVISVNSPRSSAKPTTSAPTPTGTPSRTFASTQCQTDEFTAVELRSTRERERERELERDREREREEHAAQIQHQPLSSREQRRRERRERRLQQQQLLHQQQQQQQQANAMLPTAMRRHVDRHSLPPPPPLPHMHPTLLATTGTLPAMLRPMLPDILHSHFPPPYSALSMSASRGGPNEGPPPPPPTLMGAAPQPPPPAGTTLLTPVISTVPIPGAATILSDGRFTLPLPIIRRSPSERSGKGCCGQWFAGPPLRALIAVVALGGVACALGGAALGATGLAGSPSSHLTAALLMIGVGVVLVTVSGAAWRMTAPGGPPCLGLGSTVDLGRCGRRPCSRGGGAPHGLLYPEFQHRPPPPSYQASMQEYRLRLLLLDRDRQNGAVRGSSPPPTYRSHAGSLLRAPLTTTIRGGGGSSSIGGSEYSLPPSYRSRNTTPATVCSERSIETTPSGRLLANEDLPEPLHASEELPNYNSLQSLRQAAAPKAVTTAASNQLRTSAIVEIESTRNIEDSHKHSANFSDKHGDSSSTAGKDLVTIVTISQGDSQVAGDPGNNSSDQIEILAHL